MESLTKAFVGLVANDDISFTIEAGEIVGLIGPNGAGKTTLFNCLAGFHRPTRGRIRFDGRDITGKPPEAVARLGIARTFQIVRIFRGMTTLENVLVGGDDARERADGGPTSALDALAFVDLRP